jgi:hypothetical protein
MRTAFGVCVGVALLALALPARAADKNGGMATPEEVAELVQSGTAFGKIQSIASDGKSLVLRLEYQYLESTGKGNHSNEMQNLLRKQEEVMKAKNPAERARRMEELLKTLEKDELNAAKSVKVVTAHKDFEVLTTDATKVRKLTLPPRTDDKGKPMPYTDEEKKQLKGKDTNLTGYEAALSDLTPNDMIKITFAKPKAPEKDAKDKDPDAGKPHASVIVLEQDANAANPPKKDGK